MDGLDDRAAGNEPAPSHAHPLSILLRLRTAAQGTDDLPAEDVEALLAEAADAIEALCRRLRVAERWEDQPEGRG